MKIAKNLHALEMHTVVWRSKKLDHASWPRSASRLLRAAIMPFSASNNKEDPLAVDIRVAGTSTDKNICR
jgi:hypothetical protein